MEFIDRQEEQKELRRTLSAEKTPKFVVVYGRRRLGKSTLIKHVLTDRDIYYMAGKYSFQVQLDLLKSQLSERFPILSHGEYHSWESLLQTVNSLTSVPFTLCLDEFPWIVKTCPELPSILQKLIDSRSLKFHIIICGSSQRMMNGIILSSSEPLYGRSDCTIKLRPITINYLQQALSFTAVSAIEEHSVWGGVPRYWELREKRGSLMEAIQANLVSTNGALYGEPSKLFIDDIEDTALSESILSVIGSGANRISEIGGRLGKNITTLSLPVRRLVEMGYIRREIPFGDSIKKSKKGIYRINDPLLCFYYTFIVPHVSNIERGRYRMVMEQIEDRRSEYVSRHWEFLCKEAISGNHVLNHTWNEASRWWGNVEMDDSAKNENRFQPIELDLVAESTDHQYLLIGECKWTEGEYADRLFMQLKNKTRHFALAKGKTVIYALFLKAVPLDSTKGNIFLPQDVISLSAAE